MYSCSPATARARAFFSVGLGHAHVGVGLVGLQLGAETFSPTSMSAISMERDFKGGARCPRPLCSTVLEIESGFSRTCL